METLRKTLKDRLTSVGYLARTKAKLLSIEMGPHLDDCPFPEIVQQFLLCIQVSCIFIGRTSGVDKTLLFPDYLKLICLHVEYSYFGSLPKYLTTGRLVDETTEFLFLNSALHDHEKHAHYC